MTQAGFKYPLVDRESAFFFVCSTIIAVKDLYTFFFLPIRICFAYSQVSWFLLFDGIADILAIANIVLFFFTTTVRQGRVVDDHKQIARMYLRGWLIPDIISAFPVDWILWAVHGFSSSAYRDVGPGLGIGIQFFRALRLLACIRLLNYSTSLERRLTSTTVLRLTLLVLSLLFASHVTACLWFLLLLYEGPLVRDPRFVGFWGFHDTDYEAHLMIPSQYTKSLYWAFVGLTGYGNTLPVTRLEMIFTLLITIFGLAAYVSLIGVASTLLGNINATADTFRVKVEMMNEYMAFRKIPSATQRKVRAYFRYLWRTRKGMDERGIMDELPASLAVDVALFLNAELLQKVPLFKGVDPAFIRAAATLVEPRIAIEGSALCKKGELGREMFFVNRGSVNVVSEDRATVFATLGEGTFFGEMALVWKNTRRTATVVASEDCELYVLYKDDLQYLMTEYSEDAEKIIATAAERLRAQG